MAVRRGTATPSAIFRGTVPVQKVMRGTVEVWAATIRVTPAAPTFLTESPWYTLPTQTGVTYTVSGTPGYSQTVTVTATPQVGYALAGQTSWTHTYGPPPPYEASGTIPEQTWWSGNSGERTIGSHVMQRGATVQVVAHVIWARVDYNSTTAYRFSIERNGVRIATGNPTSTVSNYRHEYTVTVTCAAGDVISFTANTTKFLDPWNTLNGGAWSISSV